MIIKLESKLSKTFSQLDQELRGILLADLGFLTLKTEEEQLSFLEKITSMNEVQLKNYKTALKKWHQSKKYGQLLKKFPEEFNQSAVPKVLKAIKKENFSIEKLEKNEAERLLNASLTNLSDG
jgi:hypothetical protein